MNSGSLLRLKVRRRCGCSLWTVQIRCTVRKESPVALAIIRPVQWVASPGGAPQVSATTRCTVASGVRGLPGCLVLSRSSPSTPASAKRCCHRHTAGRLSPVRRATSATSSRSAECRMIQARATCFCGRLRSATIAAKRWRSPAERNEQTVCAMHRSSHNQMAV
jgi:hypothetical protein